MWITNYKSRCVEVDDSVFVRLLSFYPEEQLLNRPSIDESIKRGSMSFSTLKKESSLMFIPWQMFMLDNSKLSDQLENIERNRADKLSISESYFSKRSKGKGFISKRLIDRFIRAQNFIRSNVSLSDDKFSGSLKNLNIADSVSQMIRYFEIDLDVFRRKRTIEDSIVYIVKLLADKNINVSRGTTSHGLMPSTSNHTTLYKNMSGFCLKDQKIPFIYLTTNEVVGEEVVGRQIYTLFYLLTLIGLDIYSLAVNDKNIISVPGGDTNTVRANKITSELLMPEKDIDVYMGRKITWEDIKTISMQYKVTPRAVLYRLKSRGIITEKERQSLLDNNPYKPSSGTPHSPKVITSVKKMNGPVLFESTNKLVNEGLIKSVQGQIILLGKPDHIKWKSLRASLKMYD